MKLASIETWTERIALRRPYTIAYETISDVELGFVRLRDDAHVGPRGHALVGLGCASPLPEVTGESFASCANALRELGALDPRDEAARARWRQTHAHAPAARAALDMALHDLAARARALPLAEMLGACHAALRTSITIGIKATRDEFLAEADEYVGRGFRCLKIKTGLDLEEDLARLSLLRRKFGTRVDLRIDANAGYAPNALERLFVYSESLGLELVEQPLARRADADLAQLSDARRRLVALDESVVDVADARRHAASAMRCGTFNVKLMKCGGITPALEIARVALGADIGLLWGCSDESAIGIAAALHTAFACPATRFLDLDGHLDLARDPARGGFVITDGVMQLTGAHGLGVELEEGPGPERATQER